MSDTEENTGSIFSALRNPAFRLLFLAEAISLFGDAFTWLGLALISFQFGGDRSAVVLSTALTLRVTAFILFSPFAGVLADRVNRKGILVVTHFARMGVVACFPLVTREWQLYALVFVLNIFSGFFQPAYRASIPILVTGSEYRAAVGLSAATFQLLGVMGPGVAGMFAAWLGAREIFLVDAATFVIAGVLVLMLPGAKMGEAVEPAANVSAFSEVREGLQLLLGHPYLRLALSVEFLAAVAGAQILVNTISHVKVALSLDERHYGWVMSAFALGGGIAAFFSSRLDRTPSRARSLLFGAATLGVAVALAQRVSYPAFVGLWWAAGAGQTLAEIASETLIGENIEASDQGKVFGAHFAVSHVWWAMSYPIAGRLGQLYPSQTFLWSGLAVLGGSLLLLIFTVTFGWRQPGTVFGSGENP